MILLNLIGSGLPTGYYIFMGFIIFFAVFGILKILFNMINQGKESLLEKMFENDDISSDIYKKYKKEI